MLYETWKGSNYFFCGGRCFYGSLSFRPLILTTILVTTPNVLFLSYNFTVRYNPLITKSKI